MMEWLYEMREEEEDPFIFNLGKGKGRNQMILKASKDIVKKSLDLGRDSGVDIPPAAFSEDLVAAFIKFLYFRKLDHVRSQEDLGKIAVLCLVCKVKEDLSQIYIQEWLRRQLGGNKEGKGSTQRSSNGKGRRNVKRARDENQDDIGLDEDKEEEEDDDETVEVDVVTVPKKGGGINRRTTRRVTKGPSNNGIAQSEERIRGNRNAKKNLSGSSASRKSKKSKPPVLLPLLTDLYEDIFSPKPKTPPPTKTKGRRVRAR